MKIFFAEEQKYKKRARLWAILWTLLIFVLCLYPGTELPKVDVPLADKWAHFIFFAIFSFLWLSSFRPPSTVQYFLILVFSIFVGWLVEYLQGAFPVLKRSADQMDTVADAIGGLLGILIFATWYSIFTRSRKQQH